MIKKVSDIGEFGLIRRIAHKTKYSPSVIRGIGDDCAVIRYTKDRFLLFTTDMIIEGVHFKKSASPESVGHKALAVNISDIAACGGIPKWAVVSVGLSAKANYHYAMGIYNGIYNLAKQFKINVVGGDTNSSQKTIISIALLGEVEKNNLALRCGAHDKDIICISGRLKETPDDLNFSPKVKEARFLVKNFKINSMIDISDGFLSDLGHILETSKKGAIIYESLIPSKSAGASVRRVLDIGEQFELIFTVAKSNLKRLPRHVYPVGEITKGAGGITYIDRDGRREKITPKGYRHF